MCGSRLSRVDDRFQSQIARMLNVEELAKAPTRPKELRLGGSSMMFIKFARPVEVDLQVSGMAKGWYIPAAFADALIRAGKVVGAKGGAIFTLENIGRWLNNDGFSALAREGWIGSVGVSSRVLSSYIDGLLEEKRSVVLMEASTEAG